MEDLTLDNLEIDDTEIEFDDLQEDPAEPEVLPADQFPTEAAEIRIVPDPVRKPTPELPSVVEVKSKLSQVFDALPGMLLDNVEPGEVAEKVGVPLETVEDITEEFQEKMKSGDIDANTMQVAQRIANSMEARVTLQGMQHSNQIMEMWNTGIHAAEKVNEMVQGKVEQVLGLFEDDRDNVSINELTKLNELVNKNLNAVKALAKRPTFVLKDNEEGSKFEFNFSGVAPAASEAGSVEKKEEEVDDYAGYSPPPEI